MMKSLWKAPLLVLSLLVVLIVPLRGEEFSTSSISSKPRSEQVAKSSEPVQASLVSENSAVESGKPFWVAVTLKMQPGWDTYWLNPGDAGVPTKIDWKLPDGFTAGPIQWPYPEKMTESGMVGYGYTGSVTLLTEITPPAHYTGESIDLSADVSWLACKNACMPGSSTLHLNLPVKAKAEFHPDTQKQFAQTREQLPKKGIEKASVKIKKGEIALNFQSPISSDELSSVDFYPLQKDVIDYSAPQQVQIDKGGVTLNLKQGKESAGGLEGVLVLSSKNSPTKMVYHVDTQIREFAKSHLSHLGLALGLAFVGGLILNVMPCVLPVIALKIFSFVKMAGESRRKILNHGLLFTFGVILSFWVLSGILLVLRLYGHSVGWGFQLQEPLFVATMIGILFLLGLSLFGVFEFGTSLISLGSKSSVKSSPYASSFLSGILATLVATPCTGPLLGPALGFAMTLPFLSSLSIFTVMALGMASPYLLFSLFPQWVRFLPKPGNWMKIFKVIMGFLMMATVTWLLWVFAAQASHLTLLVLLLGLVVASIAAWIYGQWGTPLKSRNTRLFATSVALLLVFACGYSLKRANQLFPAQQASSQIVDGGWEHFDPRRVAELRAEGKPVFVDFTAKWCLICQANKVSLHRAERAFHDSHVVTMVADWTNKDPVISKELEKLGRSGVPAYVLYPADQTKDPIILPQTLNAKVINDYLTKLDAH